MSRKFEFFGVAAALCKLSMNMKFGRKRNIFEHLKWCATFKKANFDSYECWTLQECCRCFLHFSILGITLDG